MGVVFARQVAKRAIQCDETAKRDLYTIEFKVSIKSGEKAASDDNLICCMYKAKSRCLHRFGMR